MIERLRKTRIPTLHEFFNTNILQHIQNVLWNLLRDLSILHRGIEGMTHLMTHQKVIDAARNILPDREAEHPCFHIKICGGNFAMLHIKIFGCQQFGESALDFPIDRHVPRCV
jgi:hypothetical protein